MNKLFNWLKQIETLIGIEACILIYVLLNFVFSFYNENNEVTRLCLFMMCCGINICIQLHANHQMRCIEKQYEELRNKIENSHSDK